MSTSNEGMISFTDVAASKVKEFLQQEKKIDSTVRLSLIRTNCMGGRGFAYSFGEDSLRDGDLIVEDKGVKVLVDHGISKLLRGTQIDYTESFQGSGLLISNPNAIGKCPCGHHDIFE